MENSGLRARPLLLGDSSQSAPPGSVLCNLSQAPSQKKEKKRKPALVSGAVRYNSVSSLLPPNVSSSSSLNKVRHRCRFMSVNLALEGMPSREVVARDLSATCCCASDFKDIKIVTLFL